MNFYEHGVTTNLSLDAQYEIEWILESYRAYSTEN